jgi:hypothetical protein
MDSLDFSKKYRVPTYLKKYHIVDKSTILKTCFSMSFLLRFAINKFISGKILRNKTQSDDDNNVMICTEVSEVARD